MGSHICESCSPESGQSYQDRSRPKSGNRFNHLSSGDVTLEFDNGNSYRMPDMILHYVADHGWRPPQNFMSDVMNRRLTSARREQTRGAAGGHNMSVGYLNQSDVRNGQGSTPHGFVERLEALMNQAGGKDARESRETAQKKGPVMRSR